jgi:hypothetical protein
MNPEPYQFTDSEPEDVPREFFIPLARGNNPLLDDLRGRELVIELEVAIANCRESREQLEQFQCVSDWQGKKNQSDRALEEQTALTIQFLKDQKQSCQEEVESVAFGLDAFHNHCNTIRANNAISRAQREQKAQECWANGSEFVDRFRPDPNQWQPEPIDPDQSDPDQSDPDQPDPVQPAPDRSRDPRFAAECLWCSQPAEGPAGSNTLCNNPECERAFYGL